MPGKMVNIELDELSLVDLAANRKKFFIKKHKETPMDLTDYIEVIKSFTGEEPTAEELAKAEELPKETISAVKAAVAALNKVKDDLTPELASALKTLVKYAGYGYPAQKSALTDEELVAAVVEKSGARLSKTTVEQLLQIKKIVDALIGEREEKQKSKGLDKLPPAVIAQLERLEALEATIQKQNAAKEAEELRKAILEDVAKAFNLKKKAEKQSLELDKPDDETTVPESELTPYEKAVLKRGGPLWPSFHEKPD